MFQFYQILGCRFGKSGAIYHVALINALAAKVAIQVIAWDRGIIPDSVRELLMVAILLMLPMWFRALGDWTDITELSIRNRVPMENVMRFYVNWWDSYWEIFNPFKPATWETPAFKTGAQADLTMGIHSEILHPRFVRPPAS